MNPNKQRENASELNAARNEHQKRLVAQIEALPAGALSGGRALYDPSDRATHYLSPDPVERRIARDYFGITGPQDKEGLSNGQKAALYREIDNEVAGITPKTLKSAKKRSKKDEELTNRAWSVYQSRYPDTAAQDFDAVGQAGARLMQRYPADTLRAMAQHNPDTLADMLADEVAVPGLHSGVDDAPRVFGGGGFGGGSAPEPEPQSMFDGVRQWQIKHGFRS